MKKFLAVLLLTSVFTFVGCGEKTTGEKIDDATEEAQKSAEEMKKSLEK